MVNLKKRIKVLKAIDVSSIYLRIEQCNYTKVANLKSKKSYIVNRKLIYLSTRIFTKHLCKEGEDGKAAAVQGLAPV